MSDVSSVTSSSTTTLSTTTTSAEESYETWITILAAQLQNQDPLDPVGTTEFTNQLIGISQLEQQTLATETLASVLTTLQSVELDTTYGYLGEEVTALGDTAPLSDGEATWIYDLDDDAVSVTLEISDTDGNVIYTTTGETSEGAHLLEWDGTTDDGDIADDAPYVLTVTATDSNGEEVDATLYIRGTVTNVVSDDDETLLVLDGVSVSKDTLSYVSGV